jgi:pyridoxal phosphate enzyme (YggS family)
MTEIYEQIQSNYKTILERIKTVCEENKRDPRSVKLVVVTKRQPVDKIKAVLDAGARYLGENYAEEAVEKRIQLASYQNVEWHIIGHVQSRKANLVADHFQMIHSLDSLKLAAKLNGHLINIHKEMPALLEINIANEESKSGWRIEGQDWKQFLLDIEAIRRLPSVQLRGLMAMPPLTSDISESRLYFQKARYLLTQVNRESSLNMNELSMGTSSDFLTAIQEGATIVRIGQAIMGPRL